MSELTDSEYFDQIKADSKLSLAEVEQFNADQTRFWKKNVDELGKILVAHLIIEHYLDEYLPVAFPGIGTKVIEKLGFSKKLELGNFEGAKTVLAIWVPGIRALNRIRNQLAHNLDSAISTSDVGELRTPVEAWIRASGRKVDWSRNNIYREFSMWVAGFIHAETNGIKRYGKGLGRTAYYEWVAKSVNTPRKVGGA